LLSVIVPVYNGAAKVERTLNIIQTKMDQLYDSMWAMELERSKIEYSLLTTGDFPKLDDCPSVGSHSSKELIVDSSGTVLEKTLVKQETLPLAAPILTWYEIIVINDGSKDKTLSVIDRIRKKDQRIRCISYKLNKGKGHAIKKGVLRSTGKYILFMDGDGDIGVDILARYVQRLSKAHIVIGSKNHRHSVVKAPLSRRLLSKCFQVYTKLLLGLHVGDTQVGLKAGRGEVFRKIFEQVRVKRYAFDTEMLAIAGLMGVKVVELPVKISLEKSFKKKEIIRMGIDVLAVAFRLRITKSYQKNMEDENLQAARPVAAAA
jgi:glycosyltransferase involved in cell wall biosynthesis